MDVSVRQRQDQRYKNVLGSDPQDPPPRLAQFGGNQAAFEQARRAWMVRERGRVSAANPQVVDPNAPLPLPMYPGGVKPTTPGGGTTTTPGTTTPAPTTPGTGTGGGDTNTTEPVGGVAAPAPNFELDPTVRSRILGAYDTMYNDTQTGADRAYDMSAGRLRDRLAQQSGQARDQVINSMVGRGIGASPALMNQAALGGVNQAESNAYSQGLTDLEQQRATRQENSLNRLNQGMTGLLGLNNQDLDLEKFKGTFGLSQDEAKRLWEQLGVDKWKFSSGMANENDQNERNRQLQIQLQRMSQGGGSIDDLMRLIQIGLG